MVLHHIAQRAGMLIERPAAFNADALRRRDLHVVDVVAVPDVLKDAVGEAEDEDVLHRLLAQVVVDAEDLVFVEDLVHIVVQRARRIQVVAEGLLDDRPHPAAGRSSGLFMPCAPRWLMMSAKYSGDVAR